ncbi:MAG: hypothetical protein JWN14_2824, partial [Chthonomonadales bacterium]|nr:hypothetical protein [Chthonomonadales bacterium]
DAAAQILLDEGIHLLPNDEAVLRLGELVRTYAIFLTEHFRGQFDPWSHLYELLEIQADVSVRWTPLDARYDRGYIVGRWLAEQSETLDTIWPKLVKDAQELCGSRESTGADPDLIAYARKNVCVSLADSPEPDWGAGLRNYIRNQHKQCSLCGSEFATQEWMAADVPNKQKVQQFSNRLSAGMTREPKRYVCTICRSQYLLDKLAYKTMDAGARCFVHFYPYSFFTPDYLESIRGLWRREKAQGVDSLMTNVSASWRESEEYPRIALVRKTVMGMPVPEFSEAVGNIFSVPINTPGDNATERFLHAIQTALLWKLWLGCRVALTEAPEPPFGDDWRGELFVDGIPASLRGLIPGNDLDAKEGQTLVTRFRALRKLQSLVLDPKSRRDPLLLLARSLSLDALEPFWVMDRLILRKADSGRPGSATFLRRDALPHLQTLVGKEDDLSHIKRLAEIAWDSKLKGDSLKDTALAKPLDVAFAAMGGYDKTIETPEDLRAVTKKDVQEAIERVTEEKYWGKTKIEGVSRFVDVLFDGLLKETYHDDVSALLTNKRRIRAAFLHYIAAQIGTKEEGK